MNITSPGFLIAVKHLCYYNESINEQIIMRQYKIDIFSLSYAEYGSPDGFPILVQHGLGISTARGEAAGLYEACAF